MRPVRALARPLIASVFLAGGIDTFRNPEPRAQVAGPLITTVRDTVSVLPDDAVAVVRANAAVQVGAAGLLAVGILPRLAAAVLAGSLVPTTVGGHAFWNVEEPAQAKAQRMQFVKNAAILGGLLVLAAD